MKSLLRFLVFVLVIGMAVAILYLSRHGRLPVAASAPGLLTAMDREFTTLVAQVLPAVVSIDVNPAGAENPQRNLLQMLLGGSAKDSPLLASGVIVSGQGHIVTNLHVVSGARTVEVHLSDGRVLPAQFVGSDGPSDIAILKIEVAGLRSLPFGDSDTVNVGQMVFAVGNPLGLEETVTQGIISAKGRRASSEAANEFFQTDAAINQGNSGGPLLDMQGRIIGITNSISLQGQGIGFAIPSNTVRRVFENIRDYGRFIRPWFGAFMRSLTPQLAQQLGLPDASGALVLRVYEGSPAQICGLKAGDVIVEFNGKPVRDMIDLRNRVVETDIGQKAIMRVRRDGTEVTVQTVIAAEPGA